MRLKKKPSLSDAASCSTSWPKCPHTTKHAPFWVPDDDSAGTRARLKIGCEQHCPLKIGERFARLLRAVSLFQSRKDKSMSDD
jgi:hypothetical protein